MARYKRSLHHNGAPGMQHREHRSKKGRSPRDESRGVKDIVRERSERRIREEEERFNVRIWKKKMRGKKWYN